MAAATQIEVGNMKTHKPFIFAAGVIIGIFFALLAAWLLYVSWHIKQAPPYVYDNIPSPHGSLFLSLDNFSDRKIGAIVLFDNQYLIGGLVSGKPPFLFQKFVPFPHKVPFPQEDGFSTVLSPNKGKHGISVYLAGVGVIAKRDFIQESNATNTVKVWIENSTAGTNYWKCSIVIRTNR